ncbi:hypothetical protein VPHD479_0116 [Vibrio phage D479]
MTQPMNRYKMGRLISNFLTEMVIKNNLSENDEGINVKFDFEKHIADRLIDREFPKEQFEKIITRTVRYHVCEMIYLYEIGTHRRINVYGDDGHMIGMTMRRTLNGNYLIKLHTCYKERNHGNRERVIKTHQIFTKKGGHFNVESS